MKTLRNLIVLGLMATTFACGDKDDGCGERKDRYYYLSADAKSKIPYTGTDTLVFVSNTGDTARCIGQGTQVTYESVLSAGPCPGSQEYEVNSTSYVGENQEIVITNSKLIQDINIHFDNHLFIVANDVIGKTNISFYRSEYIIGMITYKNVYIIEGRGSNENSLVYNSELGIIQIKLGTEKTWNIQN